MLSLYPILISSSSYFSRKKEEFVTVMLKHGQETPAQNCEFHGFFIYLKCSVEYRFKGCLALIHKTLKKDFLGLKMPVFDHFSYV